MIGAKALLQNPKRWRNFNSISQTHDTVHTGSTLETTNTAKLRIRSRRDLSALAKKKPKKNVCFSRREIPKRDSSPLEYSIVADLRLLDW